MPCPSVERRLQELLDDRRNPSCDSELIEHASSCAECRDLLETQGMLFEGLPYLPVPPLSPDFSRRVVETVVTRRQPSPRRLAAVAGCLATIAALLLVVAMGPPRSRSGEPADDARVIASATADHQMVGGLMGLSMADFDSREVRLAIEQFMAQLTADGARFYQVDQLAGTIRPLASTLNVAFDAIRRSIPGHREPPRTEPQASQIRHAGPLHVV